MNKFLKIGLISTGCNLASSFGKMAICNKGNFQSIFDGLKKADGWLGFGAITATSYAVSTVPALVGYGLGSLVDNGFAKQVISVPTALALTAGAECFTDGMFPTFAKPTLNNFKLFTDRKDLTLDKLKAAHEIQNMKYEMVDFANTLIQTELFNHFCGDEVEAVELAPAVAEAL